MGTRIMKRFLVNTIVFICSCIAGILAGAIVVGLYLFAVGTFVPIETQQGNIFVFLGAIVTGGLGAMFVLTVGTIFWETFHWEYWR